jgi:hypothetical protein
MQLTSHHKDPDRAKQHQTAVFGEGATSGEMKYVPIPTTLNYEAALSS